MVILNENTLEGITGKVFSVHELLKLRNEVKALTGDTTDFDVYVSNFLKKNEIILFNKIGPLLTYHSEVDLKEKFLTYPDFDSSMDEGDYIKDFVGDSDVPVLVCGDQGLFKPNNESLWFNFHLNIPLVEVLSI